MAHRLVTMTTTILAGAALATGIGVGLPTAAIAAPAASATAATSSAATDHGFVDIRNGAIVEQSRTEIRVVTPNGGPLLITSSRLAENANDNVIASQNASGGITTMSARTMSLGEQQLVLWEIVDGQVRQSIIGITVVA